MLQRFYPHFLFKYTEADKHTSQPSLHQSLCCWDWCLRHFHTWKPEGHGCQCRLPVPSRLDSSRHLSNTGVLPSIAFSLCFSKALVRNIRTAHSPPGTRPLEIKPSELFPGSQVQVPNKPPPQGGSPRPLHRHLRARLSSSERSRPSHSVHGTSFC